MIDITDTLELLIPVLERLSIEYAVMGGLAVRAYSIPRATYDVDLTIALERNQLPAPSNLGRGGSPNIASRGQV